MRIIEINEQDSWADELERRIERRMFWADLWARFCANGFLYVPSAIAVGLALYLILNWAHANVDSLALCIGILGLAVAFGAAVDRYYRGR